MSAVIVQDPGSGSVVGFSNNGVIGTPVQLSNQDDTGVLGWEWAIVDRPSGSVAALDDANSATPQYTPDVAGTYLIELTTYTDAGRTTVDDTDQDATGVPLAGIFNVNWRIPAATETVEASATRGWAVEVNEILKEAAKHLYVGHFDSPITAAQSPYSPQSYETVPVDTTGGAVTVDLPAVAAANKGHRILIHDVGRAAAQITIAPNGSDTIAGAASSIAIAGTGLEGDFRWLQSDGSGGWDLVGGIAVVALQDLESVLTEGANAADIGITNLGGATVTAGQALTFLGDVDIRDASNPRFFTSGGNTIANAPTGQVVQFQVNSAPIADLYAAAGVYGLSFYGDIGTTAAVYVNKPTTAINGPHAGIYAAKGGDGTTDGGNAFLRPGAAGTTGGTAGRAQLQDSGGVERFAVAADGTLEASAALDFLGIEIDIQRQGASVLKTAGANSLSWYSGGTLAATFTQVLGVPGLYPSAQNFAQWLIQPLTPTDDLGPTAGAGAAVRYSGGNARTGSGAAGGAAWVQGGSGDGAGADGDAGIRDAAGTPRIYHDASENVDKMGDLSGGSIFETTATAFLVYVPVEHQGQVSTPAAPGAGNVRTYSDSGAFEIQTPTGNRLRYTGGGTSVLTMYGVSTGRLDLADATGSSVGPSWQVRAGNAGSSGNGRGGFTELYPGGGAGTGLDGLVLGHGAPAAGNPLITELSYRGGGIASSADGYAEHRKAFGRVRTTDTTTVVTLLTLRPEVATGLGELKPEHAATVMLYITARDNSGNSYRYIYSFGCENHGGGGAGAVTASAASPSRIGGGTLTTATLTESGNNLLVQIQGDVAEAQEWTCFANIYTVRLDTVNTGDGGGAE